MMQEEPEQPDDRKKHRGGEPLFLLIMASIAGAGLWSIFMMRNIFALIPGLWYFFAVLWFFTKTRGRWKWETAASVVIGLVCYYVIFWSKVTPEDFLDAQGGVVFVLGSLWAGIVALLGDAGATLLPFLVRASRGEDEKEK